MGSFTPVPGFGDDFVTDTVEQMIKPVLNTLAEDGIPYVGFIYAGLMLTAGGPKVLEFNCRLGDPETQALLPHHGVGLAGTDHGVREWIGRQHHRGLVRSIDGQRGAGRQGIPRCPGEG